MNKIIVSVVLAISLVLIINKVADKIFYTEKPENSAYTVVDSLSTSSESVTKTESENSEIESISALFASTSSADGAVIFKKCAACHSIAKGGGNKIGPALWGTLGRKAGTVQDYKYSKGMVAYAKAWSVEEMDGFLLKPKDWVKGTKMSFAGLKNSKDRAAIILYMNENSDNPLSLK